LEAGGIERVAGPGTRWKAMWASLAAAGEPFRLAIVAEDMWGNPTAHADRTLVLVPSRPVHNLPDRVRVAPGRAPIVFTDLAVDAPGDVDLCVMAEDGEELARPNPLRVVAAGPLRRYRGEL